MARYSALSRFVSNGLDSRGTTNVVATSTGTDTLSGYAYGYKWHRFINNGTLVVEEGGKAEILLVGGGGGGGGTNGQSGGGGGIIYVRNATLQTGTYTITIGGGGANTGGSGSDSTITYGGNIAILGDQDDGGYWRMRARGGGGGAGPHGGSPTNSGWGGSGGGLQSDSQTYHSGMNSCQLPFRPNITAGGSGGTDGTYDISLETPQTAYGGLSNTVAAQWRVTVSGGAVSNISVIDPGDGYGNQYNQVGLGYTTTKPNDSINAISGLSGATVNYTYGIQGGSGHTGISSMSYRAAGGGYYGSTGYPGYGQGSGAFMIDMCGTGELESFGNGGTPTTNINGTGSMWADFRLYNNAGTGIDRGNQMNSVTASSQYYYGKSGSEWRGNSNANNFVWTKFYGYGGSAGAYSARAGEQGICIIRYLASS